MRISTIGWVDYFGLLFILSSEILGGLYYYCAKNPNDFLIGFEQYQIDYINGTGMAMIISGIIVGTVQICIHRKKQDAFFVAILMLYLFLELGIIVINILALYPIPYHGFFRDVIIMHWMHITLSFSLFIIWTISSVTKLQEEFVKMNEFLQKQDKVIL